ADHDPAFGGGEGGAHQCAGTLMMVLTTVTDGPSDSARPSSVVMASAPAVEKAWRACEMMVPTMVPPPPALMIASEPTCQNTFLAWAPLARITLRGKAAPGPPTVSEVAIWNTQVALALPCASSVRSLPWIRKVPAAAVYTPGASVRPARLPAPGSGPG